MIGCMPVRATARWVALVMAVLPLIPAAGVAQDRLRSMPGHERYQSMVREIPTSVRAGAVQLNQVTWSEDGRSVEYGQAGTRYRYDIGSRTRTEIPAASSTATPPRGQGGARPERGRQFDSATSPDSVLRAFYRDRNLWIAQRDGSGERRITSDGDEKTRIKNGVASWVYGEELNQNTAMWWSPDARRIAYYRFDESKVPDYYLQLGQTNVQSSLDVEAYPKAGVDNPIVELFVHDVAAGTTTKIDVRDGAPFTDDVIGHYVYGVDWSPDGRPSNFDPARKYPVLVSVYGGPATNGARETFTLPSPLTEYGFLVVTLDARSVGGRGKKILDAIYLNFGVTEIDDMAAGIRALWERPYVDRERVGITVRPMAATRP